MADAALFDRFSDDCTRPVNRSLLIRMDALEQFENLFII
jgi:hypothetical protein